MKTLTEFDGLKLKQGIEKLAELTTAQTDPQKTPEEIQAALGEHFKMEGDKLKHFQCAVEVAQAKSKGKQAGVKRVVVMKPAEGEKAPAGVAELKEEHYYLVEFFPEPPRKHPPRDFKGHRDGKGDRKGKRGRRGRRGPPRDGKPGEGGENREARGDNRGPGGPGGEGGEKKKFFNRRPRRGSGPKGPKVEGATAPAAPTPTSTEPSSN